MAAARPASLTELGHIGGVGARKLDAYGDRFLEVIRQW
jgi:ATP-dependent DNA helicase RecQ